MSNLQSCIEEPEEKEGSDSYTHTLLPNFDFSVLYFTAELTDGTASVDQPSLAAPKMAGAI